jgi:hypothetical protein
MFVEEGFGDAFNLDGDAGLDVSELLITSLKPEGVKADVKNDC